jgi:hypothetical protein
MVRRNQRVMRMLTPCETPLSHPFAEQYAVLADAQSPTEGPTYRQLIHGYAAAILNEIKPDATAEEQLVALTDALKSWRSGKFGCTDIWTSLVTGMLDCDALCLIAAEVLARRGWTVEVEQVVGDAPRRDQSTDAQHVAIRLLQLPTTDPIGRPSAGHPFGASVGAIYDPSPFPIHRILVPGVDMAAEINWRFLPYPASEAVRDEVKLRSKYRSKQP